MMQIGPHQLSSNLLLAPMASISDRPFRGLCREYGAGMAVSEMVASNPALRKHRRTLLKTDHSGESGPRAVQIVGADPRHMADAARFNADQGAQIIDINMGCPAKKVCSVAAGSALLKDESLVKNILEAVVAAVDIPVTLKIRTGWDRENRNAVNIARLAENAGIAALTIHGRTRACGFSGSAEYRTITRVKQSVAIPVIANGDIDSPQKARAVLDASGADAVMIGRAARGRPWLFSEIQHFLHTGEQLPAPGIEQIQQTVHRHLHKLYDFYGDINGVRIARKHIGWYFSHLGSLPAELKDIINKANRPERQLARVDAAFAFFTTAPTWNPFAYGCPTTKPEH